MGLILSEPETGKRTFQAKTCNFLIGSSAMQGWRPKMEDAHVVITSLPEDPQASFFAVFDGHGGTSVADFASRYLFEYIVKEASYLAGDIKRGIEQAFLRLDNKMMNTVYIDHEMSGATAIVVLVRGSKLYCANAGDSRAVGFAHGKAVPLSVDHKPSLPQERRRILAAGGFIIYNRVNGNLALTRAFGDSSYKKNPRKSMEEQMVTCFPDVIEKTLDNTWEFIVLACDGIWEVMTNEQVCKFVKARIGMNVKPKEICEQLMMECMCKEPSGYDSVGLDNMTVIIVVFLGSASKSYTDSISVEEPIVSLHYVCNQTD